MEDDLTAIAENERYSASMQGGRRGNSKCNRITTCLLRPDPPNLLFAGCAEGASEKVRCAPSRFVVVRTSSRPENANPIPSEGCAEGRGV